MVITAHFEAKGMDSGFQNYLSTIAETSKRREGKIEGIIEVARELKKDKVPIEQIAKTTKLTIKEIEAL